MSVTLTTTPAANVAAFAPVIIAGTTSRNPYTAGGVRDSKAITAYADNGGYVQISVTDGDDWEAEDTVLISGGSYAGRWEIISVASAYIVISATYEGGASGGTVYRMNEGLSVVLRILNASSEAIAVMYSDVDPTDGSFSHDISKVLRYEIASYFSLTAGTVSTANASHDYTIQYYETWLDPDYTIETSTPATTTTTAHMTTALPTAEGWQRHNGFHDGSILLHYYTAITDPIRFSYTTPAGTTNTAAITGTNGHYAFAFTTSAAWVKCKVQYEDEPGVWVDATGEIIIKAVGCTGQVLHYLDRYGNYLQYGFHAYDDQQATTKVDKYTGEAWKERTLYGIPFMNDEYPDIRDLITSPEVYDENLTRVRVTTTEMEYRSEEVEPKITLRYDENFMQ